MRIDKEEFFLYLKLILFVFLVIISAWSLWYSPWRVGTIYRVIIAYVTLVAIVIYRVIRFFRKQEKWKENRKQPKK